MCFKPEYDGDLMVDTRVKPEYDEKREADIFRPEDDKNMRLSTSIFNHLANVFLGLVPYEIHSFIGYSEQTVRHARV